MARLLLLVPFFCVACSGGEPEDTGSKERPPKDRADTDSGTGDTDDTDDPQDTDDTEDTDPPPVEPQSGTYDATGSTVTKDTCQVPPEYTEGTTTFAWLEVAVAAAEVTISTPPSKGNPPQTFLCPRSDLSFHCDVLDQVDDYGEYGMDARTTISIDFDGTWSTNTHIDVNWLLGVSCMGSDCDFISDLVDVSFPCTMKSTGTLDLRSSG